MPTPAKGNAKAPAVPPNKNTAAPRKEPKSSSTPPPKPDGTAAPKKATPACSKGHKYGGLVMPKDRLYLAAGLLLAAVVFFSGLKCGLVFDDHLAITKNADADARTPLINVFIDDFWGHELHAVVSNRSYRPVIMLSFRLQHFLMGYRHSALFLHLVNYAVAYLNACLVFYVARIYACLIFRDRHGSSSESGTAQLYALPAFAMALFIAHPTHVDAVTSIVGRCEVFYCFFGVCAFLVAHQFLTSRDGSARQGGRLLLIVALMVLCVFSKDSGVTFAALLLVHAATMLYVGGTSKASAAVLCALSAAMVMAYFAFRQSFIGSVDLRRSPVLRRTETPQLFVPPGPLNWLSIRWVAQMKNLELLFFPTSLCCEYSYNCVPNLTSVADPRFIKFLLVTVAALVSALTVIFFAIRKRSALALVLLLSLTWLAVPYAPVSHLFVQIGTFVAERCLYVPSIGAVLIIVFLFTNRRDANDAQARHVRYVPLVAVLALWTLLSIGQNTVWQSDVTLFRSAIDTCPTSGKAHVQLATALVERDAAISSEAEALFKKGYELDDNLKTVFYFLAIDAWQNKHDSATAYSLIRECAGDPLTMGRCYPVMEEMRRALHPNMTASEVALDDVSIAKRNADIAKRYREAAEMVIDESGDYCYARSLMLAALKYWSMDSLSWRSTDIGQSSPRDATFCDTTGRLATVAHECYLVQRPREFKLRNTPSAKVFKHGRILSALARVVEGVEACETDWANESVFDADTSVVNTYPAQVARFVPLATHVLASLAPIYDTGFVNATFERKVSAEKQLLEIALRRYCAAAQLADETRVTHKLQLMAPQALREQRTLFKTKRNEWLQQIHTMINSIYAMSPADADTRALLQKFVSCVPDLLN